MNLFAGDQYSNGRIDVALDKPTASPGETLNGYVELEVTGEFSCAELRLTFAGVARSTVMYTERVQPGSAGYENQGMDTFGGAQDTAGQQRMAVGSHSVCQLELQVASFPSGVAEMGVYQFPFQLPIPEGIPASVAFVKGTASNAQVLYTLSVKASRPNFACIDVVKEVPVDISIPMPAHMAGGAAQYSSDTVHVVTCCCCKKGDVTIGGRLANDAYSTNEEIALRWQMKNASRVKVESVKARLVCNLVISSHGYNKHLQTTAAELDMQKAVAPGMRLGYHPEGTQRGSKMGTKKTYTNKSRLDDMLTATITVPEDILPSTSIKGIMSIGYVIELEAQTNLFSTNPKVRLPILLYRSAPVPADAWTGAEGNGGGVLGVPVTYTPNESAKTTPGEVHVGWTVVSNEEDPAGALYEYAGYTASGGGV